MEVDELYDKLQKIILKMTLSDNVRERIELRRNAHSIIKEIKQNHACSLKLSDDLSKKLFDLVKENKKLRHELAFIEIAAGRTLFSQLKDTVFCIKQGIEYVENEAKRTKGSDDK